MSASDYAMRDAKPPSNYYSALLAPCTPNHRIRHPSIWGLVSPLITSPNKFAPLGSLISSRLVSLLVVSIPTSSTSS